MTAVVTEMDMAMDRTTVTMATDTLAQARTTEKAMRMHTATPRAETMARTARTGDI